MEERMIFLNLHIRNTGTKSWEKSYLMLIYFDKDLYSSMKPDGKDYIFWYKMGKYAMMERKDYGENFDLWRC